MSGKDGTIEYGADGSVTIFAPPAALIAGGNAPQVLQAPCLLCDAMIPPLGPAFQAHVVACAARYPERYAELVRQVEAGERE